MSTERLLLDTHALLWWQAESDRLSSRAAVAIAGADRVWISAISLWEVATLTRMGRVALDRPIDRWATDLLAGPVESIDVDSRVAVEAGSLVDFHGDPADRIIYSTAKTHSMALVTKDRRISHHSAADGSVSVVW